MTDEQLKALYDPKMKAYLEGVTARLREMGLSVDGPEDWRDGIAISYWWLGVFKGRHPLPMRPGDIDISFKLIDSTDDEGEDVGVTFHLEVNRVGDGECHRIARVAIDNYTPDCWVPRGDPDAIERRFQDTINSLTADDVVDLISENAAL